jgi:hypothetical protein
MKNSELAKYAYNFEQVVRETFEKCRAALPGARYDFDGYELTSDSVKIVGYDYSCGGDYKSFTIPISDLDDIDAFVGRRQAEIAEEARWKEAQKLADDANKKAIAAQKEHATYLKLKEKQGEVCEVRQQVADKPSKREVKTICAKQKENK